jgi:hypothetical protein
MKNFSVSQVEDQKVLMIGDDIFDWALDEDALAQVNQYAPSKSIMKTVHSDIKNHFLDCLAEHLGYRPTMKQVNDALKEGFID